MAFFDVANGLDDYRNDRRIKKMLQGCHILNHIEFMSWYMPEEGRFSERNLLKNPGSAKKRLEANQTIENYARYVLQNLSSSVCEGQINETYGHAAMNNLKNINNFDLLVVMDPSIKIGKFTNAEHQANKKLSAIIAFIIVEKGECKESNLIDRSDVYSVNLICRREEKVGKKSVKGVVLLGAYMYCIKNSAAIAKKDKIGILELAGAYRNLSGFFSYTKVGFDKDYSLFGKMCFKDAANLPMSVDINQYSSEDIIQLVCGDKKRDPSDIKDDTGIYELGLPNKNDPEEVKAQAEIAEICTLKHKMFLNFNQLKAGDRKIMNAVLNQTANTLASPIPQTQSGKLKVIQKYADALMAKYKKKPVCEEEENGMCTISGG
jgi:hypothetical protein